MKIRFFLVLASWMASLPLEAQGLLQKLDEILIDAAGTSITELQGSPIQSYLNQASEMATPVSGILGDDRKNIPFQVWFPDEARRKLGASMPLRFAFRNCLSLNDSTITRTMVIPKEIELIVSVRKWRQRVQISLKDVSISLSPGEDAVFEVDVNNILQGDFSGIYSFSIASKFDGEIKHARSCLNSMDHTSANFEELNPKTEPDLSTDWGQQGNGLRCQLVSPQSRFRLGSEVPLVFRCRHEGVDDDAQLYPNLGMVLRKNAWERSASLKLAIENRIRIRKGEEFEFKVNLPTLLRALEIEPGTYSIQFGFYQSFGTDSGDWHG